MISSEITNQQISGMDRLFQTFPRDTSFAGAYLMGILLHDNEDIQFTYTIRAQKTFIIGFRLSNCIGTDTLSVPTQKPIIQGIEICLDSDQKLRFEDATNGYCVTCKGIAISHSEIIDKEFCDEQKALLTQKYSETIIKKFIGIEDLRLKNGEPLFRRDDYYNGIATYEQMMYKLPNLKSADGCLEYEFLIEFDKSNPCVGIYYGCKGLILKGDSLALQKRMEDEWICHIMPHVRKKLNAIFPDKNFDNRFKPTDNANNNTFWPFWLTLYEDENMTEVAVRATIIIRTEYKKFLEGDDFEPDETCKFVVRSSDIDCKQNNSEAHSQSRLTEESFDQLMSPWKDKNEEEQDEEWRQLLTRFLDRAQKAGLLSCDVENYEKAFQFRGDNTTFAVMMQLLINRMKADDVQVPWATISKQFLDKNGNIFKDTSMKSANTRFWRAEKDKFWRRHKLDLQLWRHHERLVFEAESSNKIVVEFRHLME